jgi:enoyl reductase
VTYRRATHHVDSYRLTAAVTWEISWTGTGIDEPQELPEAIFESTRDIEVREIQAIVAP